ncbi:conserved Plasmodium protein, unknown function [Plasmodium knowlesi strain H]|uniref:Uncharacterized protein n=2 Tax=Plasmodium knowlesi TaxID=5850 RepID=B3L940_PLAKH|nr:conserved Plasmodium protein, unknown function [Plasmodium knowlesi strain H]OTN65647.1 Uncharacterized protein PKNOH_S110079700 [Plasmodium knowlesi]CAA9989418.1 conserved Plasmodium protein, unknown function [Plasmodium knowlesi strain H]VVS78892.1 conserved Plasmodium protein, unknown function [Plasmodium knowlesi strain H]|eukprot:XP_002260146.1 hypothetical protein, conserved in Plasmodium species [Plasmodium knowlesi strain H]
MVHLNCNDKLYSKTELYRPFGDSTLDNMYRVPLNYFNPPSRGLNGNPPHTSHEERANSAVITTNEEEEKKKKKKKKKAKIHMCYNCKASTTGEIKSTPDNTIYVNDKYINNSKKGNYKHAMINVRTDEHSTESDYSDAIEDTVPNVDKWKKPRKIFMGKYFFSEIDNSLLHPWHVCPSTTPQSGVVNPRLDSLHYSIWTKKKGRGECVKPEIIVRF